MDIVIGMQNVAREVSLTSNESVETIEKAVHDAIDSKGVLRLEDEKGNRVLVPAQVIGYVHIGAEEQRKVGFGA